MANGYREERNAAKKKLNAAQANYNVKLQAARTAFNKAKATAVANHKKLPVLKRIRGPNLSINAMKNKFNWFKQALANSNKAHYNYENAKKTFNKAEKTLKAMLGYVIYNKENRQKELNKLLEKYPVL